MTCRRVLSPIQFMMKFFLCVHNIISFFLRRRKHDVCQNRHCAKRWGFFFIPHEKVLFGPIELEKRTELKNFDNATWYIAILLHIYTHTYTVFVRTSFLYKSVCKQNVKIYTYVEEINSFLCVGISITRCQLSLYTLSVGARKKETWKKFN